METGSGMLRGIEDRKSGPRSSGPFHTLFNNQVPVVSGEQVTLTCMLFNMRAAPNGLRGTWMLLTQTEVPLFWIVTV